MATQTGSIDLTASNSVKLMADAGFESVEENYYTKAELDVTVQGINTEVSKKVNGTEIISTINQSAESVSINANKINLQGAVTISDLSSNAQSATLNSNISVGGRNLVVASKISNGYLASNGSIGTMNATRKEGYSDYIPVSPSESLVFQAWVTVTDSSTEFLWMAYEFYNSSKAYIGSRPTKYHGTVLADGRTHNSFDGITVPDGAAYIRVSMRRYDDGVMKLEVGNKATDWSPAPEDVDSAISNAAKTATSYVTEITGQNGIMVHPSGDQTTGVQITSDVDIMRDGNSVLNVGTQGDTTSTDAGVTIYDGTASKNVVARFDSDEVSLGANSNSSTIDMCGGMWNVSVDTSDPVIPVATIKANGSASAAQNVTPTLRMVSHADYDTYSVEYGVEVQTNDGIQYPVSIVYNGNRVIGFGTLGMQTPGLTLTNTTGSSIRAPYGIHMITATGTNSWSTVPGTVLWSGAYHMVASHTANLKYNVSTCPTGIVLHFQPYSSSTIRDYYHNYVFVPKVHATGISVHLCAPNFQNMGTKYLYVYDAKIVGNDDNNKSGTNSGITYNNATWVMTQVIAV